MLATAQGVGLVVGALSIRWEDDDVTRAWLRSLGITAEFTSTEE